MWPKKNETKMAQEVISLPATWPWLPVSFPILSSPVEKSQLKRARGDSRVLVILVLRVRFSSAVLVVGKTRGPKADWSNHDKSTTAPRNKHRPPEGRTITVHVLLKIAFCIVLSKGVVGGGGCPWVGGPPLWAFFSHIKQNMGLRST